MGGDDERRRRETSSLRQRLIELTDTLGVRVPVYILVTKCDMLAGFHEFFLDLDEDSRHQVLGITFPAEQSEQLSGLGTLFHQEFDNLLARLSARRGRRMRDERRLDDRARLFGFVNDCAKSRKKLQDFLTELLRAGRNETPPLARGIYFTSGAQERSQASRRSGVPAAEATIEHGGAHRSFFLHETFSGVILPEADLVGTNHRLERRIAWIHWLSYAAAGLLIIAVTVFWGLIRGSTQTATARLNQHISVYHSTAAKLTPIAPVEQVLPALAALQRMRMSHGGGTVWGLLSTVGLTVDFRLTQAIDGAYYRALRSIFAPRLAKRIGHALGNRLDVGIKEDRETRTLLGLYLMFASPDYFSPDHIQAWLENDWAQRFSLEPEIFAELDKHLTAWVGLPGHALALDPGLIARARRAVIAVPVKEHIFHQLREEASDNAELSRFNLLSTTRSRDGQNIFAPDTDRPSPDVPGFYTEEGFQAFLDRLPELNKDWSSGTDWVLGAAGMTETRRSFDRLALQITELYSDAYIDSWKASLAGIRLRSFADLDAAHTTLRQLAGPDSPLLRLLQQIRSQTLLQPISEVGAPAGKASVKKPSKLNKLSRKGAKLSRLVGGGSSSGGKDDWPGAAIVSYFEPLHRLVEASDGEARPVDELLRLINDMLSEVTAIADATDRPRAAFDAIARRSPSNEPTKKSPTVALRQAASRQAEPVRHLLEQLARETMVVLISLARDHVDRYWQRDIAPSCRNILSQRYPIERSTEQDVALADFARLFGPDGKIDTFFRKRALPFINTQREEWRNADIEGQSLQFSDNALAQLKRAAIIRVMFFPTDQAQPEIRFSLRPVFLDPRAIRVTLDLDGTRLIYRHEAPRTTDLVWPRKLDGGDARVSLTDPSGRSKHLRFTGPWAFFRLVEALQPSPGRGPDEFRLTVDLAGEEARFLLKADSISNPFRMTHLRKFQCPPSMR